MYVLYLVKHIMLPHLKSYRRPNQLFRQCVPDSDRKAKQQLQDWESSREFDHHLLPSMRLRDITRCLPEMWKVSIHIIGYFIIRVSEC